MAHIYDNLESVVTTARVRINDAIKSPAGNTLTDNAGFTIYMINAGWRRMQDSLASYGCSELKEESTLLSIAANGNADPTVRTVINWSSTPPLPDDLISPLKLWERPVGGGAMSTMGQVFNGLPLVPRGTRNKIWEWRRETIYMPGASIPTDIQLRYMCYLPDFVANATTAFSSQTVPITRSLNPFAWFICSEFSHGRGDLDTGYFDNLAEQGIQMIWGRDPMQYRSIKSGAEYQQMRDATTPLDGAGPPPLNPAPMPTGGPQ